MAVELRFGPGRQVAVAEALAQIRDVLRSNNEFCDQLKAPAEEIVTQFESARTIAEVIAVASRLETATAFGAASMRRP